jgi:hypothetical protein
MTAKLDYHRGAARGERSVSRGRAYRGRQDPAAQAFVRAAVSPGPGDQGRCGTPGWPPLLIAGLATVPEISADRNTQAA